MFTALETYLLGLALQNLVGNFVIGPSCHWWPSQYQRPQFYEIAVNKLLGEGLDKKAADEIAISVWEQLPNRNIRNCVQIGRLVRNEPDIEMAIADEIQNFKEYGVPQLKRSTDL